MSEPFWTPLGGAVPGQVPLVTALPGSPVDGDVIDFTDSLTAPTYMWRLRYVAAKASNKWVFVGGSPLFAAVDTQESSLSATYAALATAGPSVTLPVAGDYLVAIGYLGQTAATGSMWMSYDIGGTAAIDADGLIQRGPANTGSGGSRERRKTGLGAVALVAKYKSDGTNTQQWSGRWMRVHPIAIGG